MMLSKLDSVVTNINWPASLSLSPALLVRAILSLPAKSTRDIWLSTIRFLSFKKKENRTFVNNLDYIIVSFL